MSKPTNLQLVELLQKPLTEKWGYVWGLDGELYTQEMADKFAKARRSPPPGRNPVTYWTQDCKKWIGRMAADCGGVIVWCMQQLGIFKSTQDRGSGGFKDSFVESGAISKMPEIPGLGLWRKGHIAVYEGNGLVLEERGTSYGMVRTKLKDRDFTHWGKFPGIDYSPASPIPETEPKSTSVPNIPVAIEVPLTPDIESDSTSPLVRILRRESPMQKGEDVVRLQERLLDFNRSPGEIDGEFGKNTEAALKAVQTANGLPSTGEVDEKTNRLLWGNVDWR